MSTAISVMILVAILVAAGVGVIVGVSVYKRRQSARLRTRFGVEYDRTIQKLGDRSLAEAELEQREARVSKLTIRPLTEEQVERFSQAWSRV